MIIDMSYWTRVLKKFLYVILILVGIKKKKKKKI